MSTHLLGFRSFFRFLHHFVLGKLATSSIRVKQSVGVSTCTVMFYKKREWHIERKNELVDSIRRKIFRVFLELFLLSYREVAGIEVRGESHLSTENSHSLFLGHSFFSRYKYKETWGGNVYISF